MAAQRKLVALLASDSETSGHALSGQAHREIGVGIVIDQPRVGRNFAAAHGDHGHGFGAACEHDFGGSGHDALGGHGDGLQSGGAEAIDGDGGDFDGESGAEGGDAGNVHSLLGFGHGAAEDDVFDFFGVELGDAVERAFDGAGGQFVGTGGAQRSFIGSAYGGADGGDDYYFSHEGILLRWGTAI